MYTLFHIQRFPNSSECLVGLPHVIRYESDAVLTDYGVRSRGNVGSKAYASKNKQLHMKYHAGVFLCPARRFAPCA